MRLRPGVHHPAFYLDRRRNECSWDGVCNISPLFFTASVLDHARIEDLLRLVARTNSPINKPAQEHEVFRFSDETLRSGASYERKTEHDFAGSCRKNHQTDIPE